MCVGGRFDTFRRLGFVLDEFWPIFGYFAVVSAVEDVHYGAFASEEPISFTAVLDGA